MTSLWATAVTRSTRSSWPKPLNELASEDAVVTYDVGTPAIWVARYVMSNGRRRLIGSLNHGSMANALPQAIGAQASHPGRQVRQTVQSGTQMRPESDVASAQGQKTSRICSPP